MLKSQIAFLVLAVCPVLCVSQTPGDGWTRVAPTDLSEAKLRAMSAAVRTEEFKKIGSIVIARHGKLVFEDYVEGDARTLRDTRSATKTITGILVGIAIQDRRLSGIDAKVL